MPTIRYEYEHEVPEAEASWQVIVEIFCYMEDDPRAGPSAESWDLDALFLPDGCPLTEEEIDKELRAKHSDAIEQQAIEAWEEGQ